MSNPEALLAHADWVERLARTLVADPSRAEDVVQETWVAALERPPRAGSRAWLGAVARNTARRLGREDRARSRRERLGARPEATSDVAEVAARAALSREVVGDVLALDEPYRSVVLLRWFEDQPPREIARRLGRPVATVKTQLGRAHAELRQRLVARHGEERWGAALAPLAAPRERVGAPPWAYALAGAALVLLLGWSFGALGGEAGRRDAASLAGIGVEDGAGASPSPSEDRYALHFVDSAGRPLPDVTLRWSAPGVPDVDFWTDASGVVHQTSTERQLVTNTAPLDLLAGSFEPTGAWVIVADGWVHPEGELEQRWIVLARTTRVDGRVTAGGDPVARARLSVHVRADALERLAPRLRPLPGQAGDHTREFWTMADEDGQYAFEVPVGEEFRIVAARQDLGGRVEPCPGEWLLRTTRDFELDPDPRPGAWIEGEVVDAERGSSVVGATIDYGYDRTRSGPRGRFRLELTGADRDHVLTALAPGLVGRLGGLEPLLDAAGGRLSGVRLSVAAPRTIRGRVLDAAGAPCPGWFVVLRNGTPFGSYGSSIEHEASGADGIGVTTDAEGRFELGGLFDREYEVLAHDEDGTYVALVARRVRAGVHDLVLQVPGDALLAAEEGVVVDPRGNPLAGHTVGVSVDVFWNGFTGVSAQGRGVTTDEEGRFVLRDVPWRDVELAVWGPDVDEPATFPFGAAGVPVRLVVPVTYRFELDVGPDADVTAVELHTVDGEALEFHVHEPDYVGTRTRMQLSEDGRRTDLSVTGEAAVLVLFTEVDGEVFEVDRSPLSLVRGVKPVVRR